LKGRRCKIVSADDFFTSADGNYLFDGSMLQEAHGQCRSNARDFFLQENDLHSSVSKVADHRAQDPILVVDNTNIENWMYTTYENLILERFENQKCVEPMAKLFIIEFWFEGNCVPGGNEAGVLAAATRNIHGVPFAVRCNDFQYQHCRIRSMLSCDADIN
jgi:hypothetical protein